MMKARCPKCGQKLGFSDDAVGRRGRCGACGQLLAILRRGRLFCLEMDPCEQTVVTPSRLVVNPLSEPDYPPQLPQVKHFKIGDHIGLYQPWVLMLIFGGMIVALVSLAALWPMAPPPQTAAHAPVGPIHETVASPNASPVPAAHPTPVAAYRPAPTASPPVDHAE